MKNTCTRLLLLLLLARSINLKAQDFSNFRLSKIMYYNYNANKAKPDMVYDLSYDTNGNLQKMSYYQDGKLFQVNSYQYNKGKLVSYDSKNMANAYPPGHITIEYDDMGKRIKKTEILNRNGKKDTGIITLYLYNKNTLTRIKMQPTFSGNISDTIIYKTDNDGYIQSSDANSSHPNPLFLTGNGEVDLSDNAEWPVSKYFTETPVVDQPTFGTTATVYKYDSNGLLISSNWKYVTEKENFVQSTGKTIYTYINLNKKSTTKSSN